MMRRIPMEPDTTPIKLKALGRCERIEAREVTKFPARYRKPRSVPPRDLGRYQWNTQRIVDEGLLASGDAALSAEIR